jgi:hypothetical protein
MSKLINPMEIIQSSKSITPDANSVMNLSQTVNELSKCENFSTSPFVQYFHAVELQNIKIDLVTALQIDLYPLLIPEIQFRIKTNQNMNWSVFGAPGTGKSLGGLSVYEHISRFTGVTLKTRNMFTNGALLYNRLLDLFPREGKKKDLQKNDVIFVDENPRDQTGLGSVHAATQTTEMEIRIRKAMIHFIWVSTVLQANHQSTVVLETYDAERDTKDIWKLKRIRFLVYSHDNALRGALVLPAPSAEVIDAYTKHIKDEGLKSFFAGEVDQRSAMLRQISEVCLKDPKYTNLSNREQRLQYIDEKYGYMRLAEGQKHRILGLSKPIKKSASESVKTKDGEIDESEQ